LSQLRKRAERDCLTERELFQSVSFKGQWAQT